ncbi:MAG: hypothetical protein AAGB24_13095 [Bacteroidota bacterium]
MSEFFKAELKDRFLRYASERDDYFETQLLYDEFLRPNYTLQYVEKLIREIIDHDTELLDIMSGNGVKIFMLSSTAYTEDFLEEGGFTDLYIKEEEKWDAFLDQLSNTRKLSSKEKAILGETDKLTHKKERILLFFLITAVAISFLYTIFSIIKSSFTEEEYITRREFERKLEQVRSYYDKENTSLKTNIEEDEELLVSDKKDSIW